MATYSGHSNEFRLDLSEESARLTDASDETQEEKPMKKQDVYGTAFHVEPAMSISTTVIKHSQGTSLTENQLLDTPVRWPLDLNGESACTFRVTVNYARALEDMIKDAGYTWSNPDINAKTYPVVRTGIAELELQLVNFDRVVETQDVVTELHERSFRSATLPDLLAYSSTYNNPQPDCPIVALGSSWLHPCGGHRVPFLWTGHSGRRLDLYWLENRWERDFRFLAIRQ
jgi:hypothetical protein